MRVESIKLETVVDRISGIPVVKTSGEIDTHSASKLKTAVNRLIDAGTIDLIVDLSNVSYMDSSGFGILLGAVKRVRAKGGVVNLVGCSEAVIRMLGITKLDLIFETFDDVESAVSSIQEG